MRGEGVGGGRGKGEGEEGEGEEGEGEEGEGRRDKPVGSLAMGAVCDDTCGSLPPFTPPHRFYAR